MFRKILCVLCLCAVVCGVLGLKEIRPAYAADFKLVYSLDNKTSFSEPDKDNVVKIRMVKEKYVEDYWIQYYRDWFVVRSVECENVAHMEAMLEEVYARQYYAPNPRVTAVRDYLLSQGSFTKPLADTYKDIKVRDAEKAEMYISQFINVAQKIGPALQVRGPIVCEKKIVDMEGVTYYYMNVMQHKNNGNGILAKFQVNQYGEIFYYYSGQADYINVDNLFVID